jgi:hypothetical protein
MFKPKRMNQDAIKYLPKESGSSVILLLDKFSVTSFTSRQISFAMIDISFLDKSRTFKFKSEEI